MASQHAPREARSLGELLAVVHGAATPLDPRIAHLIVRQVTNHSARVEPGALFVAVPGHERDGLAYVREAIERGAIAILTEKEIASPAEVPVVRVADARRALAQLAAGWFGNPADRLSLVGITGTIGKTSVLSMVDVMLRRAGVPSATIGSLGIEIDGDVIDTGHTAPDALVLHEALARIVEAGMHTAAMEVTSHALVQRRVEGLVFDLGVFLNLVPFEHVDYHRSFRAYVDAKARFLDHLRPGAPIIYNADDRAVRGLVRGRDVTPIACGTTPRAALRIEAVRSDAAGMRFDLNVRKPLHRLDGSTVGIGLIPLEMRLLGRANAANAALAAGTALCLGADAAAVHDALRGMRSPKRRMELQRIGGVLVLDDTVGHPDSVSAVFATVPTLGGARVHVVFGIRGSRGRRINSRLAETLAIYAAAIEPATLVVTSCTDTADDRNVVSTAERDAFVTALEAGGVAFEERAECADAVALAMRRAQPGDLVLLLGAQGMDAGARLAREAAAAPAV